MPEGFIERYRKEQGYDEGYTEAKFLADVLANSYSQGFCDDWMLDIGYDSKLAIPFPIEFDRPCFEERIAANVMAGKCRFLILNEDGDEQVLTPGYDSWLMLLHSRKLEVKELLHTFLEGQDDAFTADALLQHWLLGDCIFG